jgi:DNA-binding CsgD family transcriptional regulator/tetratricopeptide (TPR) repeat protein
VYDDIPEPVRTARHREAVAVVLDEGRSIVEAAEHVLRSGPRRDREAVTLLRGAADEIAGRAPGTAADYLVHALQIMGTYDPYWPALAAEAVNLLMSAGRLEEATPLGEAALQGELAPDTRAMLLLGLAEGGKHSGQNRAAVEYARRGLSIEEISDPVRARLYGLASHALLYVGDGSGAAEAGLEAIRLGDRTGEHSASVFGKVALSVVTRTEGRLDESLVWAQRAVEHAERVGGEALHRHPGIWLGNALESLDRLAEARKAYVHAQQEAERLGTAWSRPLSHFHLACLLAGLGRLEDAVNEAEAGLSVADRLSAVQLSVPLHGLLAVIAVLRNEHPIAREHLRQLDRLQDDGVTAAPELDAWPRAVLAEGRRDPQLAMTHLGPVYDALPGRLLLFAYHPGCGPAMVRMALAAGDPQRADAAAAAAQLMADRHPGVPSLVGGAQHAKAILREDPATFGKAIETLRQGLRPLMLANALEDAAEAEYRAGSRSSAVEYLQEALDIYLSCGARQAVERVRRRRPVIGVTHSTEDDPNPTSPLDRLTPTEREVAHWVAQGMTNRQVARQMSISPHTVDTNLRKIFGKLGINTRVELTRIVTDEERDSP